MHISDPLRAAVYAHAGTGVAVLHVPKAAGSAIYRGIARRHPVLSLPDLEGTHRPGCPCRLAECQSRARHERTFISRLRSGRPWLLHLGHLRLTVDQVQDIPAEMPIVVPLRDSAARLVSYFRYYWTMAEAARHSRVLVTRRHAVTWMPVPGVPLGTVPRASRNPRHVAAVQMYQWQPAAYLHDDGHGINWQLWLDDALGEGSSPLLYRDLLPDLLSPEDPRWSRLSLMGVADVVRWVEESLGARVPQRNISRTSSARFGLEEAAAALAAAAPERVRADDALWSQLTARQIAAPAAARGQEPHASGTFWPGATLGGPSI